MSATIGRRVREKTYYTLKSYCLLNGLSYSSLKKGFIGKKSAQILERDGIVAQPQRRNQGDKNAKASCGLATA
ncbi:MAG: hypothetical protein LBI57_03370 [Helicobacteraceae bacterium]|jgi:hypothetical protein|nr:hypothetical protein [Helicobacteraceae bacterium]